MTNQKPISGHVTFCFGGRSHTAGSVTSVRSRSLRCLHHVRPTSLALGAAGLQLFKKSRVGTSAKVLINYSTPAQEVLTNYSCSRSTELVHQLQVLTNKKYHAWHASCIASFVCLSWSLMEHIDTASLFTFINFVQFLLLMLASLMRLHYFCRN